MSHLFRATNEMQNDHQTNSLIFNFLITLLFFQYNFISIKNDCMFPQCFQISCEKLHKLYLHTHMRVQVMNKKKAKKTAFTTTVT